MEKFVAIMNQMVSVKVEVSLGQHSILLPIATKYQIFGSG